MKYTEAFLNLPEICQITIKNEIDRIAYAIVNDMSQSDIAFDKINLGYYMDALKDVGVLTAEDVVEITETMLSQRVELFKTKSLESE